MFLPYGHHCQLRYAADDSSLLWPSRYPLQGFMLYYHPSHGNSAEDDRGNQGPLVVDREKGMYATILNGDIDCTEEIDLV